MARKVTVAGVSGTWLTTKDGQRLRIIGNWIPKVGGIAYTDGTVVYGYSLPGYVAPPRKRPKVPMIVPFYQYSVGSLTDDHRVDVYPQYFDGNIQRDIKDSLGSYLLWYWNPHGIVFANDPKRAYVLKDSTGTYSYVDDEGNTVIPSYTDACVFAINNGHYKAQTGDYRYVQRENGFQYWNRYGVRTKDTSDPSDFIGYGLPLRGQEHDLSYETDSTTQKSGNMTALLDRLFSYIQADLAQKQGTPPSYPTAPPTQAILDFALYPDNGFRYYIPYYDYPSNAYGERRMEYCGDSSPTLWLTVEAVAYGGTHQEYTSGPTGWWPIIYRYSVGIQDRDVQEFWDKVVYWKVESAAYDYYISNLSNLPYVQTEYVDKGYEVSYHGYVWKAGTLKHGDTAVALIPKRPHGLCVVDGMLHIITDDTYYRIKGQQVEALAVTGDRQYVYSNNGSLCPIDDVQRIVDAYYNAYY